MRGVLIAGNRRSAVPVGMNLKRTPFSGLQVSMIVSSEWLCEVATAGLIFCLDFFLFFRYYLPVHRTMLIIA